MIYRYRATLPGSKVFYRVYEIKGDMTLFSFNSFILNDLGFAPDQMVVFDSLDADGVLCSQYGLFDMGDGSIDKVTFDQMIAKGETVLHYVFDLRNERYICLTFEGEGEFSLKMSYPCMLDGKGPNPDQFNPKYEDPEEYNPATRRIGKILKPGDGVPVDDDDDDDFDDDEDDDEKEDDELLVDEDFEGDDE
jgi:hypothetical protein